MLALYFNDIYVISFDESGHCEHFRLIIKHFKRKTLYKFVRVFPFIDRDNIFRVHCI